MSDPERIVDVNIEISRLGSSAGSSSQGLIPIFVFLLTDSLDQESFKDSSGNKNRAYLKNYSEEAIFYFALAEAAGNFFNDSTDNENTAELVSIPAVDNLIYQFDLTEGAGTTFNDSGNYDVYAEILDI